MKIKSICFFTMLSIQSFATYVWTQKATFPGVARIELASFSIGVNGYIACGIGSNVKFNDCWQWNSTSNVWTQMASLPSMARYGCSGFSINSKGYVVCGWNAPGQQLNELWEFSPVSNSWMLKASFPGSARYTASAFVINDIAYVGLGYQPYTNDFYKYDGITDTWTQIPAVLQLMVKVM